MWLITVLDDHSRYLVNHGLFKQATAEAVLEVLKRAMAKHGLPKEILTDIGSQFVTWMGVARFEKPLQGLGIYHTEARLHHPHSGKVRVLSQKHRARAVKRGGLPQFGTGSGKNRPVHRAL